MATESVKIIIGAEDNSSQAFGTAAQSQQQYENQLAITADTTARSTAALAIMLQVIGAGGGEVGKFIGQLALFKGSLDSLRAAQAENANGIEKLIAKAGLLISVFSIGYKIAEFFSGGTEAAKKLNEEVERTRKLAGNLTDSMQRNQGTEEFKISLISDPDKQISEMKRLRDAAEKELKGSISSRDSAKKAFEENNNVANNWIPILSSIQAKEKALYDISEERVDSYKGNIQGLTTQINQLELAEQARFEQLEKAEKAERSKNIMSMINAINEEATALSMSADELERYTLAQNDAIPGDYIRLQQAQEKRAAIQAEVQAQKEQTAAIEKQKTTDASYIEGLKQQLIALRDGTEAAEAYKAAQSGVSTVAQLEGQQYQQQIALLEKRNELQAKAKQIIEGNLTPLEKFKKDYQELAKVKLNGLISQDVFQRELTRLKKGVTAGSPTGGNKFIANSQESSRFLNRARGSDPILQTNENTKKTAELLAAANVISDSVNKNLAQIKTNTAKKDKVLS